jgi:hypothetical protein
MLQNHISTGRVRPQFSDQLRYRFKSASGSTNAYNVYFLLGLRNGRIHFDSING